VQRARGSATALGVCVCQCVDTVPRLHKPASIYIQDGHKYEIIGVGGGGGGQGNPQLRECR